MLNETLHFLGYSQTFYGVLVTLIVLFQYLDEKSNFIFDILNRTKEELEQSMRQHNLRRMYDAFENEESFVKLKRLRNQLIEKADKNPSEKASLSECNNLFMDFKDSELDKGVEEVPQVKELERILVKTQSFTEQFRAPLYTLIFALLVFIYDELLSIWIGPRPEMVLSLGLFTFFSLICWIILWSIYLYNCRKIKRSEESKASNGKVRLKPLDQFLRKQSPWVAFIFKIVVELLIVCFVICICDKCTFPPLVTFISVVIASAIIPVFLGLYRTVHHSELGNYKQVLIIGHCLGLFILSVLIAFFVSWLSTQIIILLRDYEGLVVSTIKALVFLFTIFNGLILSFILPYYTYRRIYNSIEKKACALEKSIEIELANFRQRIQEILLLEK